MAKETKSNVMDNQLKDFGEKIGGARKDLWKDRGLYTDDLDAMNDREAEKFVKKDNIWKKPDYEAMVKGGVPLGVVYFIKKTRDSLAAAPQYRYTDDTPEKRMERQKEYVRTVRELQEAVSGVRTVDDVMKAYDRFFVVNGYLNRVHGCGYGAYYRATEKGQENLTVTNKLCNAMKVSSPAYFEHAFTQKAKKEQFCVPKEQKVPKGYAVRLYDGKKPADGKDSRKPGTYYVVKGYRIIKTNFESQDAALKWVQELVKKQGKSKKVRFTPPHLEHVERTGPDFRGGVDIIGQDYLDTFGFRGGEFGNWMNQNDRQASLNMGFDALKDLVAALQSSNQDIAFHGELSIAFGARGSGNAAAHYEPMRKVINLTKIHGAGSLAHEWWHALDDYLGSQMGAGGMLSKHPRYYPLFGKLIETMKYRLETEEQAAAHTKLQEEHLRKNADSWLSSTVSGYIKQYADEGQMQIYEVLREEFLAGKAGSVDKINAFKKAVTGRVIPKGDREHLEVLECMLSGMLAPETPQARLVETEYYKNSLRMGKECQKDGGYWESNEEMTARAFACYIQDRLPYRSDYLDGHAECAVTFITDKDGGISTLKAFPEGEERKAINAVFDEIVADLKQRGIFANVEGSMLAR